MGRKRARIEETLFPRRRYAAISFATELCCVDRVVHRVAAVGYHRELLAGLFSYVIANVVTRST
jgi:hypothetical protein